MKEQLSVMFPGQGVTGLVRWCLLSSAPFGSSVKTAERVGLYFFVFFVPMSYNSHLSGLTVFENNDRNRNFF